MRSDLTTIPLEEIFEPKDGCPICRLYAMLEERTVDYITGAAMMEPDVRIETNKQGFCFHHFEKMLNKRNRLSVALMMESHLASIEKRVFKGLPKDNIKKGKAAKEALETCFICNHIETNMEQMLRNICVTWERDYDFRHLFAEQETLCLHHFADLTDAASKTMSRRWKDEFCGEAASLSKKTLDTLQEDVSHFCKMFDYRNTGENADWGNSKDSLERSVHFLTGNIPNSK